MRKSRQRRLAELEAAHAAENAAMQRLIASAEAYSKTIERAIEKLRPKLKQEE